MTRIASHKHRGESSNGDRANDHLSRSSSALAVSTVPVAPSGGRAATEVPNHLPPEGALTEAEIHYHQELDDFLAAREAERGDPWREFLGPLLRADEVRELVGLSSLEALDDLVKAWRILALPTRQGEIVYPAFQFDRQGQPYPSIGEIIEIMAPVSVTPYTIASWLMSPKPYFDDLTPIQWLASGRPPRHVADEARLAADHMAHF